MNYSYPPTFRQLLAQAIADIAETGYISREAIDAWIIRLRNAAEREFGPEEYIHRDMARALGAIFDRLDRGKIADFVPGVSRYKLAMIKPQLHAELDRRIMAATDLIKLRRGEAVDRTLARLLGWSTSIPPGGDETIDKHETRTHIGESIARFKFERRRVDIDQSQKLIANISDIVAKDAGAIAGIWHSHGEHDTSYDARKDHLARANKIYVVRDSWARHEGLVTKGAGYTDEITAPAQEPFCRCWYEWILSPRQLPDTLLTTRGQQWIANSRMGMAA